MRWNLHSAQVKPARSAGSTHEIGRYFASVSNTGFSSIGLVPI
jgi:hypothetical protein